MGLTDLDDSWDRQITRAVARGDPILVKVFVECAEADDVLSAAPSKRIGPRPRAMASGRYLADVAPEASDEEGFRVRGVQHALVSIVMNGAAISASGDPVCSRTAPAAGSLRRR